MNNLELKEYLDYKSDQYNNPNFIENDPIQIPHLYTLKEDIEVSGFLSATIAWGNRKMIIKNAHRMMELMGNSPYDFVMNHRETHLEALESFVHRTFNGIDFITFINGLKHIYTSHNGMENIFANNEITVQERISNFKRLFFEIDHHQRTEKHLSDPLKGSSSKRLNMFLRWMVRNDNKGVDLGIWKNIKTSELSCPLDIHSGNTARRLGILLRKQNDAKAVIELDASLRNFDANDPVKYDFALFGIGVME